MAPIKCGFKSFSCRIILRGTGKEMITYCYLLLWLLIYVLLILINPLISNVSII